MRIAALRPVVPVVLLGAAFAAFAADDRPAFDCAKAESSAEELICEDAGLAALDRRLADRYAAALDAAEALDAGAEAAADELRATQRGWIKGRDECWKSDDLRACVEDAYLSREGELVALWLLEEPTARTFWTCESNPANEVAVWFFDTERPSIRIEYGDSIDAGTLAPAASGARYAASFGREFWEKGGESLFTWEQGVTQSCVKTAG
jgi:uncharacterized protein YecT (DUF1311 family)